MKREESLPSAALNRGPWKPEEDLLLKNYIEIHGVGRWSTLPPKAGLKRCGKSCRLRWMNYLRPNVKRGHISADEEDLIIRLHKLLGNRWSLIAARVPGRTDNDVKNFWNIHLSKKLKVQLPRKGTKLGPAHAKSLQPPRLQVPRDSISVPSDELNIPSQSSKIMEPDLDYKDAVPILNTASNVSRSYKAVSEEDELHKTESPSSTMFHFQQHCHGEGRILCDMVGLGGVQCATISNPYCNGAINGLDSISDSFWFDSFTLPWLDGDKLYCNYGFDSANLSDDVLQAHSLGSTSTSGI